VLGLATAGITAYVAITKIATVVSAAFTAAIPGLNVIMGVVVGVAALTAGIVALREATQDETEDVEKLTVESRKQYYQMRDLEDEYNEVVDAFGETSYEAQVLRRKVDEATEAFEENRQTVKELAEAHDAVSLLITSSWTPTMETISGVDKEARSNQNLMKNLEELMAVEGKIRSDKARDPHCC
jgi:DNA repair ATPase RecN